MRFVNYCPVSMPLLPRSLLFNCMVPVQFLVRRAGECAPYPLAVSYKLPCPRRSTRGFGRLNHHGPGHRPRNRRRMKSVVHEAFGDVLDGYGFELAQIEDAFVSDQAAVALVKNREKLL